MTAGTGICAQACTNGKTLSKLELTGLSTSQASLYYYDYSFIKKLKRKTVGQGAGSKGAGWPQ
jgi:hypothetical protein